jgi:hypothetical protein
MINLDISNYTAQYAHLNGQKTQNIKPFDLARAMVTVGQGSWTDVCNLGIYRIGELICKALAFSKLDSGNLVLQDRFHNLNQSEKATVSYYFGQGLTKLYAESFFKIKWLFHVDDYTSSIQFNTKGFAASKLTVGKAKKTAQRPDLIGIEQTNVSHIFEAKGNSGGYHLSVMQHAINQVSQVRTYNGVAPVTRAACYFDLSCVPIKGIIIDPEDDENGIDIKFNEEAAILKYYSFFRENSQRFNVNFQFGKYEFLITPVGVPNIYFGFDKRLLNMKPAEILLSGLYNEDSIFPTIENSQFSEVSLGLDGLILINAQ